MGRKNYVPPNPLLCSAWRSGGRSVVTPKVAYTPTGTA